MMRIMPIEYGARPPRRKVGPVGKAVFAIVCVAVIALSAWVLFGSSGADEGTDAVKVVISYSGSWSGSYGDLSSTRSVDGTGMSAYVMTRSAGTWSVSAVIQKLDDGPGVLTVSIMDLDDNVLKTSSTTAAYGVVTVATIVE